MHINFLKLKSNIHKFNDMVFAFFMVFLIMIVITMVIIFIVNGYVLLLQNMGVY